MPVLAASSFERTATPDLHRIVHRLSAPLLRKHRTAEDAGAGAGLAGSVQRAQTVDRARRERQMRGERNAWQWGRDMEAVREADVRRGVYQLPRRTFAGDDIEVEGMDGVEEVEERRASGFEGRGDWAQREAEDERLQKEKGRRGVREIVRVFGLGRRKSKGQETVGGDEDEAVVTLEKFTSVEAEGKRSRRSSFLARLRWNHNQGA